MISVQKCKEILWENYSQLSDKQVEEVRNFLYAIANLVIDNDSKGKKEG